MRRQSHMSGASAGSRNVRNGMSPGGSWYSQKLPSLTTSLPLPRLGYQKSKSGSPKVSSDITSTLFDWLKSITRSASFQGEERTRFLLLMRSHVAWSYDSFSDCLVFNDLNCFKASSKLPCFYEVDRLKSQVRRLCLSMWCLPTV